MKVNKIKALIYNTLRHYLTLVVVKVSLKYFNKMHINNLYNRTLRFHKIKVININKIFNR
jgi:hypothetical protein